ncbi:MAG: TauD/TfdA family dioxygenase [Pseudomonadota bacterium]
MAGTIQPVKDQDTSPSVPVWTRANGAELIAALGRPPYAVVCDTGGETEFSRRLLESLAPDGSRGGDAISFTRIRVAPEDAGDGGLVTRMSRTNAPIPAHTDCSYMPAPHNLVAFEIIEADSEGGASILVDGDTLVRHLDPGTIRLLSMPIFPFGRERYSIVKVGQRGVQVRYYRAQVDKGLELGHPLPENARQALGALDAALERPELQTRILVASGQTLFFANRRVLHGRTGFAATSQRLMHRYRMTVPELDLE